MAVSHAAGCSEESLRMTLGVRLKRSTCFLTNTKQFKSPPPLQPATAPELAAGEPLVLYEPQKEGEHKVEVDPMLTRWVDEWLSFLDDKIDLMQKVCCRFRTTVAHVLPQTLALERALHEWRSV